VPNDSFDAFSSEGAVDPISPTDLKVMDVIGYTPVVVSCFAAGTRIATARGEVAVNAIRVGDRVQVLPSEEPAGKTFSEVIWTGRREVDCARHPHPQRVWPVRVAAGAFGPGQPHSALFLSPDHAIYIEGVLIPIKHLINGTTIAQIKMDRITYHHIELPEHDVLLAQGLPTESFLAIRDGANYANHPGPTRLYPDHSACIWEAFGCAPLVVTGPQLEAARALVRRYAPPGQQAA
jgi:collagen type I alpha